MLIRNKILYSTIMLTVTLLALFYCSLRGVYAYRGVTKSLKVLSSEVESLARMEASVDGLKSDLTPQARLDLEDDATPLINTPNGRAGMVTQAASLITGLEQYRIRILERLNTDDPLLTTNSLEVERVDETLAALEAFQTELHRAENVNVDRLGDDLQLASLQFRELFGYLTDRMQSVNEQVKRQYRTWIGVIVGTATTSLLIVVLSFWFFRHSVVQPFKILLSESREVANGNFDLRIRLKSQDELAEMAGAMNSMTERFVQIRDNLNDQVQQRTREVVRSEQLASVGFLAAGVAHEINNPLASIAWSAEGLESRLHEILHPVNEKQKGDQAVYDDQQIDVLRKYLRRIQDEAFRCKGITERLLDFSRLNESEQRVETDIHAAVTDVVALVKHLGQYRNRTVKFQGTPGILATVSPTEFKQVVLNLLTNSLDAIDDGGQVDVHLEASAASFELKVTDQGCGMTPEVMQHLFEPFYTRRRDGKGTGLGLSITYRIVQDHGGTLVPHSRGEGKGAEFVLTLPRNNTDQDENNERRKAA